ncbi:MAG: hypothetical protein PHH83_03905 [Patescibacteria group bacterium]|nr:hypothetical protein [Patescibacteria group bacterium]
MINSSGDILYLTLTICVICFTVFLCWFLFYLIMTLKKIHDVVNFFSKILTSVNEFVIDVKQKAKGSMAYFKLFGVITEKLVNYIEKKAFKDLDSKQTKTKSKKTHQR